MLKVNSLCKTCFNISRQVPCVIYPCLVKLPSKFPAFPVSCAALIYRWPLHRQLMKEKHNWKEQKSYPVIILTFWWKKPPKPHNFSKQLTFLTKNTHTIFHYQLNFLQKKPHKFFSLSIKLFAKIPHYNSFIFCLPSSSFSVPTSSLFQLPQLKPYSDWFDTCQKLNLNCQLPLILEYV